MKDKITFEGMINYMVVRGYSVRIEARDPIEVLSGTIVKIGTPVGEKVYQAHTPLECMQLAYDEISKGIGRFISVQGEAERALKRMIREPGWKGCGKRT